MFKTIRNIWDRLLSLNEERSIWVEEEELGREKIFYHREKRYFVRIPPRIHQTITLHLKGLGKKRKERRGDLYLHLWLNKGRDVSKCLWLSESAAREGADKRVFLDTGMVTMIVPPKSRHGLTLRLKGYGSESMFPPHAPPLRQKKRGNALVRLFVYPDLVIPSYGTFEALSTEDMALEGWVYRNIDEVVRKIGRSSFPARALPADAIADQFNQCGWRGVYEALRDHLRLNHLPIQCTSSDSLPQPGSCQRSVIVRENRPVGHQYLISINEQFLDNPFTVAAILAHELCHVVYSEKIDETPPTAGTVIRSEKATLEEEHTVDLLAFMFRIGEFQLRVARDRRLTLGYFHQEVFERMQVIVSKKLDGMAGAGPQEDC